MKIYLLILFVNLLITCNLFPQRNRDEVKVRDPKRIEQVNQSGSGNNDRIRQTDDARLDHRRNGDREKNKDESRIREKEELPPNNNIGSNHAPSRPGGGHIGCKDIEYYPDNIITVTEYETRIIYTSEKEEGLNLLKNERYIEALEYFNAAIDKNKKDIELYYLRGLAETGLEYYDDAIENFTFYLNFFDDDGEAYYRRGLAKFYNKQKKEAYDDFVLSIKYECDDAKPILKKYY